MSNLEEWELLYENSVFKWSWKEFGKGFLGIFGALWLLIESAAFFELTVFSLKISSLGLIGYSILAVLGLLSFPFVEFLRSYRALRVMRQESPKNFGNSRVRILRTAKELVDENSRLADEAQEFFVATGSRSRDKTYLDTIEAALRDKPNLIHYRILFGPPFHQVFKDHLIELLKLRDPQDRTRTFRTIFIALFDDFNREPEKFIAANEFRVLIILPSFNSLAYYDTAIVIDNPDDAQGLFGYVRECFQASTPLDSIESVEALPVLNIPT